MKSMTRSELIHRMAARSPLLKTDDVELAVLSILEKIQAHLADGGRVEIRGFGVLTITVREARLARNPKTGERVQVPEKARVHFRPGKVLAEAVDHGTDRQEKPVP